jgi:glycosyltransferase involved in cell wall biosynthesis
MKIIINTSTLKQDKLDSSPEFINNLVNEIAIQNKENEYIYFYPMKQTLPSINKIGNITYQPYRYWFTKKGQVIGKIGILQSLRVNKFNYVKVAFLLLSQLINLFITVRRHKPDYIYSHWVFPQAFITSIISKITNTKYVFTSHGSDVTMLNKFKPLGKIIMKYVIRNSEKFTVVSSKNIEKISDLVSTKEYQNKLKVIPMGVDDLFFKEEINLNTNSGQTRFIYFGRLTEYKGIDLLIRAFHKSLQENPNMFLNIIGQGNQHSILKNLIKDLDLQKNINLLSFQNKQQLIKYIDNSNIAVIPSIETKYEFEAGPLSVVEAMARKKICIVSDSIGFMSYLNNESALIFSSGSEESLTSSISKYLKMDDIEKSNILNASEKIVEYFNFKNISKEHNDFLFKN